MKEALTLARNGEREPMHPAVAFPPAVTATVVAWAITSGAGMLK